MFLAKTDGPSKSEHISSAKCLKIIFCKYTWQEELMALGKQNTSLVQNLNYFTKEANEFKGCCIFFSSIISPRKSLLHSILAKYLPPRKKEQIFSRFCFAGCFLSFMSCHVQNYHNFLGPVRSSFDICSWAQKKHI